MTDLVLDALMGGGSKSLIMPFSVHAASSVSIKEGASASRVSTQAAFYTALEVDFSAIGKRFDVDTLSPLANSSEQTITDITGQGVLTNVISSNVGSNGQTLTIRVTRDGITSSFTSVMPLSTDRMVLGDVWSGGTTSSNTSIPLYGGQSDTGFDNNTISNAGILTPEQVLNKRLCGIPFKTSLKVTIQSNGNLQLGGTTNKAVALYTTYIPEGF